MTDWHRETDVVIAGGGLAGYCAALEAVAAGASVLLFEKQPAVGGSSVLSGGFSRNEEMLRQYVPHQAEGVRYGGARQMRYLRPHCRTQRGAWVTGGWQ